MDSEGCGWSDAVAPHLGAPGTSHIDSARFGSRRVAVHNSDMRLYIAAILSLGLLSAAEIKLGKPLTVKEPMPLATLLAKPADYVGKTVQVKGKITEVCQMMGCWLDLTNDEGQKLRIKVNDGEIEFPKDAAGKMAVAEGQFNKLELTASRPPPAPRKKPKTKVRSSIRRASKAQ